MHRISSNATLFLKIFFPTLWLVFFGIFTITILLLDTPYYGSVPAIWMKLGLSAFFLSGLGFFYLTLFRLKRVELDELYLYASNYFKTYRYPYHNIEKITERDMVLFHIVRVHLKTPGHFGKKITFLLGETMFKDFLGKYPEVAKTFEGLRAEG
ncbi:MAG: hypothetical protein HY842_16515 [Bacteroidetes bacterium]|nr:hypothetical protein [Bacteroidota bacterium]